MWKGAARERGGGGVGDDSFACVHGLRHSKQSRIVYIKRTEPPLNAPSMALRGFGGRPVRQFLDILGTVKNA